MFHIHPAPLYFTPGFPLETKLSSLQKLDHPLILYILPFSTPNDNAILFNLTFLRPHDYDYNCDIDFYLIRGVNKFGPATSLLLDLHKVSVENSNLRLPLKLLHGKKRKSLSNGMISLCCDNYVYIL